MRAHLPKVLTLLTTWLLACGGGVRSADRPVLSHSEDDDLPGGGLTCQVVQSASLPLPAELGRPALSRGGHGELIVAWVGRRDPGRQVLVQRLSPDLAPLGPPGQLDGGEGMPLTPALASCGETTWVAWQLQEPAGGDTIRLAVLDRSGADVALTVVAGRGQAPALGCLDRRAALTWSRRDAGVRDIYLRWISPTGQLGDRLRISGETDAAEAPALACAVDRCGVVWSDRRHTYAEIYGVVLSGDDAQELSVHRISQHDQTESGAGGAYAPGLATDDGREFLAAWHDTRSHDESEIYAAPLSEDGRHGDERRISRSPASSTAPALARCGAEAALAWRDGRYGPPSVMLAAVDTRGRRSSAALALSRGPLESSAPALACGAESGFVVAWTGAGDEGAQLHLARVRCR